MLRRINYHRGDETGGMIGRGETLIPSQELINFYSLFQEFFPVFSSVNMF